MKAILCILGLHRKQQVYALLAWNCTTHLSVHGWVLEMT